MRKVFLNVSGKVQGVGFRWTTKKLADQLGVSGEVWNEGDGSVSIVAMGEDDQIEAFIEGVRRSPSPLGKVDELLVKESLEEVEIGTFKVVYKGV
ncbi:MAG: acylphosphatase [Streptococcaceae bacterium]|jgi:acylphosphatase|nr:acylphosphatase [Streptococcaceae bacterium]